MLPNYLNRNIWKAMVAGNWLRDVSRIAAGHCSHGMAEHRETPNI
jgi:hypothetical protein